MCQCVHAHSEPVCGPTLAGRNEQRGRSDSDEQVDRQVSKYSLLGQSLTELWRWPVSGCTGAVHCS